MCIVSVCTVSCNDGVRVGQWARASSLTISDINCQMSREGPGPDNGMNGLIHCTCHCPVLSVSQLQPAGMSPSHNNTEINSRVLDLDIVVFSRLEI